ncbi:MAG: WecB/TagA/CpsF family glycosyltransferase, partial [Planctomycetota bacterium]
VPDGQPVRWALGWLHRVHLADRVYGPLLMLRLCERAAAEGIPIFLFGGSDALLAALCDRLTRRMPALAIAGVKASRFRRLTTEEQRGLVETIRASGAGLMFIGLGCPRQEVCAFELQPHLSLPLVTVGAAFSFHAGLLPQAPPAMQKAGLEWLYRLVQEPQRLWRRYVLLNPLYLALVLLQRIGLGRFDPDQALPPTESLRYG